MSRTQGFPEPAEAVAGLAGSSHSPGRILFLVFPAACLCFAILLGLPGAFYAPDSAHYRLLALGQRALVPPPFSARILGPFVAAWLGHVSGRGVDTGFLILGVLCLVALIALIAAFLWSWRAPVGIYAAMFLMPFWIDMFHDYYLPDLLHAVLLAAMLGCLWYGRTTLALLLLLPAYLARESTLLVALCLVFALWRRIHVRAVVAGVLAMLGASMVSRHFSQVGPASVHGLSGAGYIVGKLVWSVSKNLFGLPLWSNTLPECSPVWMEALPQGAHLGAISSVGLCQPSLWGPGRLLLAWFGIFGLGPAFFLVLWRKMLLPSALKGKLWRQGNADGQISGRILVFRFCLIYGLISVLMTPFLGASADRLVEYGWPLYFIVLPWFAWRYLDLHRFAPALLSLHLVICWLAWYGFRQQTTTGYVLTGVAVLALNLLGYLLTIQQRVAPADGASPV